MGDYSRLSDIAVDMSQTYDPYEQANYPTEHTARNHDPNDKEKRTSTFEFLTTQDEKLRDRLSVPFSRRRQFFRLFWEHLAGWMINALLAAGFAATVLGFEKHGAVDDSGRRLFNTLSVGIPLLMALNTTAMLKGMAEIIRWKILSHGQFTVRQTDMILNLSSYRAVLKLLFSHLVDKKYFRLSAFYLLWLFLMIGAQVATGLLGLAFDSNKDVLFARDGEVFVINFTQFNSRQTPISEELSLSAQQWLAHSLGDGSWANVRFNETTEIPTDMDLMNKDSWVYQLNGDWEHTTVVARLHDWTKIDEDVIQSSGDFSAASDRYVMVNSSCEHFLLRNNSIEGLADADEFSYWWDPSEGDYLEDNMKVAGHITYLTQDFNDTDPSWGDDNQTYPEYVCGSNRCSHIGVYLWDAEQPADASSATEGNFYMCNTTVSSTHNAAVDAHKMSDAFARLAANSIALDGISDYVGQSTNTQQFGRYSNETFWGLSGERNVKPDRIEQLLARFSAGSILQMDTSGPFWDTKVAGKEVYTATRFVRKSPELEILLCLFLGIQIILIFPVIYVGSTVLPRDSSFLSMAIFLKPLLDPLENAAAGEAAPGKKLAKELDRLHAPHQDPPRWTYGYKDVGQDGETLYRPELMRDTGDRKFSRFKDGRYE